MIGTRNGRHGAKEPLFLGTPANRAAKIIATSSVRVTDTLRKALPKDLQALCTQAGDVWIVSCADAKLVELLSKIGITWNREKLADRVKEQEKAIPLDAIEYAGATERIDFETLSEKRNKRVTAVSLFADIDGFTKFVSQQTSDKDKIAALRIFHAIRKETVRAAVDDYDGVQVQHQGDRLQVIANIPADDEAKVALEAVKIAVAIMSAMEKSLQAALGGVNLHYGIGVDIGTALATRLGTRGFRDNICLGASVVRAEELQERFSAGKQIVISGAIYAKLPNSYQVFFNKKIVGEDAYIAEDFTQDRLEKAAAAAAYTQPSGSGSAPAKSWCDTSEDLT